MIKDAFRALRQAERPVLIFGAGVRLAGASQQARELAGVFGIPVAPTWAARDLFPADDGYLCVGGFGTHGTRAANFAVQNADWILSVGARLDSKATGTPLSYFARAAHIFMVDVDSAEIGKFKEELGRKFSGAQADAKLFLSDAVKLVRTEGGRPDFGPWRARCREWLAKYPACRPEYEAEDHINPYVLAKRLSAHCQPGENIVSDTGLSLAWMMQTFEFKEGQQFIHAFNQTPMGYGLPAAIGAAFARSGRRVVLVTGDGGFMLNIQELPLLVRHKLPIKIVLINNGGHAMCRQTQEQWLGGKYYSTSVEGGLAFPNFQAVAEAHGLRWIGLDFNRHAAGALAELLEKDDPALLEVAVDGAHRLIPLVQHGKPNEDGNPPLSRAELREQMIVGTVDGGIDGHL